MQEYGTTTPIGLNGLVPDPGYPPGADYASWMRNLRASESGPVNPAWFTAPFNFTLDWPFPAICRGENVTLLFNRAGVATLATNWAASSITVKQSDNRNSNATLTGGGVWHTATFEDNWFATNGTDFLLKTAAHTPVLKATGLTVRTLCAHDDRLVLAGLEGAWFSSPRFLRLLAACRRTQPRFFHDQMTWSNRWVVCGEKFGGAKDAPFYPMLAALGVFGTAAFDAFEPYFLRCIERGQLSFASLRKLGAPEAMGELGDGIAVYSKEGRIRLVPTPRGDYDVNKDQDEPGVANRGALSGNKRQHAWLTPTRELYSDRREGARLMKHGHRFTGSLTNLVASFDPHLREHFFSTENWCYGLNDYGVFGPLDIRPTGLCRADGLLVGAGANLNLTTLPVELYSHTIDMGRTDSKRVQNVHVVQKGLSNLMVDVKASVATETPFSLGAVQANPVGVGYAKRSGNKFEIGATGTGTVGGEYGIHRVVTNYQTESRRHQRGIGNLSGAEAGAE